MNPNESKIKLSDMYGSVCKQNGPDFYLGRIRFILDNHLFSQREQMLGMILSAALGDRSLSASDLLRVMSSTEEAHRLSMEANYNEGWKV